MGPLQLVQDTVVGSKFLRHSRKSRRRSAAGVETRSSSGDVLPGQVIKGEHLSQSEKHKGVWMGDGVSGIVFKGQVPCEREAAVSVCGEGNEKGVCRRMQSLR